MLSCSGNNLAVPHDLDPSGDDVLPIVGGHLNVHSSSIAFEVGGHIDVPCPVPEAADLGFVGVHCSGELVNTVVGFGESLVGDCCASMYCADEAVCNGVCSVIKVIAILHAKDGLSQARGDRRVVPDAVRGNVYMEWGW